MQHFLERIVTFTKDFLPNKAESVQYAVVSRHPNDGLILTTITIECSSEDCSVYDAIEQFLDGWMKHGFLKPPLTYPLLNKDIKESND